MGVTCGDGVRKLKRECNQPKPQDGGANCIGDDEGTNEEVKDENCTVETACAVNGGWSEWKEHTPCSVTCGDGVRKLKRDCNQPKPQDGGANCIGDDEGTNEEVKDENCTVQTACPGMSVGVKFGISAAVALGLGVAGGSGYLIYKYWKKSTRTIVGYHFKEEDCDGKVSAETKQPEFDVCRKNCDDEETCVAFSFIVDICKLYESTNSGLDGSASRLRRLGEKDRNDKGNVKKQDTKKDASAVTLCYSKSTNFFRGRKAVDLR